MARAVAVDDPKFWHDRAIDAWATAARVVDPEIKRNLIEIAQRYDAIAKHCRAGRSAPTTKKPPPTSPPPTLSVITS